MTCVLLTYIIYCLVILLVIGWAGFRLHEAGKPFVREAFEGDIPRADLTNDLLLLGYYLVNIGYSLLRIRQLGEVNSQSSVVAALSDQIGRLVLILAVLHYINICVLWLFKRNRNKNSINHP